MTNTSNQRLLEPLELKGPAVDRDRAMRGNNGALKTVEEQWNENGRRLDAEISEIEIEFFAALKKQSAE